MPTLKKSLKTPTLNFHRERTPLTKQGHQKNLKYSFKVRLLKKVFFFLALGVVGIVLAWPKIEEMFEAPSKPETETVMTAPELTISNQLINPRLRSVDAQGRPYLVKAHMAENVTQEKADLTKPHSELELEGKTIKIDSDTGTFNEKNNHLVYEGNVRLELDGHTFTTSRAEIDFDQRQAEGKTPVSGKGPLGSIDSKEGFEVNQEGQLKFKGRTKLILHPKK